MRDEDERCVRLVAEFVCPTLIAGVQRKEERPGRGEFRLGEAERSFVYHGRVQEAGGAEGRIPREEEDGMAWVAADTVASRILEKMEVVTTMQRLGRKLECVADSVAASCPGRF